MNYNDDENEWGLYNTNINLLIKIYLIEVHTPIDLYIVKAKKTSKNCN